MSKRIKYCALHSVWNFAPSLSKQSPSSFSLSPCSEHAMYLKHKQQTSPGHDLISKYIDLWMLSTGEYLRLTLTSIQVTLPWKFYSSGHVVTWWIVSSNVSAPFSILLSIVKALKTASQLKIRDAAFGSSVDPKMGVKIRTNSQQRYASDDCRWIPSRCIGVDCGWMETTEGIHGRINLNRDRRGRVGVEGD